MNDIWHMHCEGCNRGVPVDKTERCPVCDKLCCPECLSRGHEECVPVDVRTRSNGEEGG